MASRRLLWLAEVLRTAGLEVVEVDGWETRGRASMAPRIVLLHHSAAHATIERPAPSLRIVTHGRQGLKGPLSQLLLDHNGIYYVVASGKSNHAGKYSASRKVRKAARRNRHCIGIEAENSGLGQPWPQPQIDAYVRGVAAICAYMGWDTSHILFHRTWAPGRKIDPAFVSPRIDLPGFRQLVEASSHPLPKPHAPTPPAPPKEAPMYPMTLTELEAYIALSYKLAQTLGLIDAAVVDTTGKFYWLTESLRRPDRPGQLIVLRDMCALLGFDLGTTGWE